MQTSGSQQYSKGSTPVEPKRCQAKGHKIGRKAIINSALIN